MTLILFYKHTTEIIPCKLSHFLQKRENKKSSLGPEIQMCSHSTDLWMRNAKQTWLIIIHYCCNSTYWYNIFVTITVCNYYYGFLVGTCILCIHNELINHTKIFKMHFWVEITSIIMLMPYFYIVGLPMNNDYVKYKFQCYFMSSEVHFRAFTFILIMWNHWHVSTKKLKRMNNNIFKEELHKVIMQIPH